MKINPYPLVALVASACVSGIAVAETGPLTLAVAVDRALQASPALQAAALELDIATGQREWDALKPPVWMALQLEDFAGSGNFNGIDQLQATLGVRRRFEGGGKAELRGTRGTRRVDLAGVDLTITRLDVVATVERLFFDVLAAQANEETAKAARDIAQQTWDIVNQRVAVGRSSDAELNTASVRKARGRLLVEGARHRATVARMRMASVWGDRSPDFRAVAGDILRVPKIPLLADLERRLEQNPEIRRLETEGELASAEQRLAAAQAKPDWLLGAGVRYFEQSSDAALVATLDVPFGQKKRAQPLGQAAAARVSQVPYEIEQRRRELLAIVISLHAEIAHSNHVLTAIRDEMLPQAIAALDLYRDGFERGGYTLLELTESQNLALRLRQELVDTATELHLLRIELERLTGAPLTPGATS